MRADIQVLRAVAVGLVVGFHLFPGLVAGGFVGVDVFFVVSGFLITAHLLRDARERGRIRLAVFWARRARRLLPASLLVLAATLVAVVVWVPQTLWQGFTREAAAAALYVQNWVLAGDAVDYLAAENAPSPVQHFWSLSAEEQFYFMWPLLVGVTVWWIARRRPAPSDWMVAVPLGVIAAASLGFSVWYTARNPEAAYFITPTRAWEFALGGVLACLPVWAGGPRSRMLLFCAGMGMIFVAAFSYSGATAFPGYAALLPVTGALLVLFASVDLGRTVLAPLRAGPVRWIGDASYSIYLWHWPLIILWPYAVGSPLNLPGKLVVLSVTVALAAGSYHLVENPVRRSRFLVSRRPRLTLTLAGLGMLAVVGSALLIWTHVWRLEGEGREEAAQQLQIVEQSQDTGGDVICLGAEAVAGDSEACAESASAPILLPPLLTADQDKPKICRVGNVEPKLSLCTAGVPRDQAEETVVLVGDSHAAHWFPALREVAEAQRWHMVVMLKDSCPFTNAVRSHSNPEVVSSCVAWNSQVRETLEDLEGVSRVFVSAAIRNGFKTPYRDDRRGARAATEGYLSAWEAIPDSASVYIIRGTPYPREDNLACLADLSPEEQLSPGACARARDEALLPDPMVAAALQSSSRFKVLDLSKFFCDAELCHLVVGNVLVYRDAQHMTATYSETLAPYLWEAIASADG